MLVKSGKRGEMGIWECDSCEKHFQLPRKKYYWAIYKKQKRFCSKDCRQKYWRETASKRVKDWVKRNGGSRLTKGYGVTHDGYIWVRIMGNGYWNNEIKLHRYLMEVKLGRKLKSTEIVHHINGDKLDNNVNNLQILTRGDHNKLHFSKKEGV